MRSIDDIIRRTAMRTLGFLVKDACDQQRAQIEEVASLVNSDEQLDYEELVRKITALKKKRKEC
jgi:hypothetical protein